MLAKISISDLAKLPESSFYVISNGKLVENWKSLTENDIFHVFPRILGGKGGFGSLLRSFGSQFYKSTNQDMCRDLTGRRLKDVKEEEKLKKYINKAHEREELKRKKAEQKYEKLKKLDSRNESGRPLHNFNDSEYVKTKQEIADKTEDAVTAGLKMAVAGTATKGSDAGTSSKGSDDQPGTSGTATTSRKRPADPITSKKPVVEVKKKKPDMWLGMNDFEDDSDSDSETQTTKTTAIVHDAAKSNSKRITDV